MTEPIRPMPRASPPEQPSTDGADAVETPSTQAGSDPSDGTTAKDPDPDRPAGPADPTETVGTVADSPPADVGLTRDIPAPGLAPQKGDEEGATLVLPPDPHRLVDTLPDAGDGQAGRLGQVAGYEILGVLGRGAMGVVYKARQRGLRRIVALKMIGAGSHCTPNDLARFRSEAEAVADLQHPHIVRLYEVGEDEGRPFFSLEYVEGQSLAARINGVPQPPLEAARMVMALADAMEHAHRHGIIHRDLKPANVLVTTGGEPKVTDFGLVKRLEDESGQTLSGSILGTPSFMAPEQAEGRTRDISARTDVYGLGTILYQMLTGRPPFRAASVLDTLEQVRTREPIPPSQFEPKLPRDLETIDLKCLQKDPAQRYASAAVLAQDLRRFLAGEPILARPVGTAEWCWRWCRRNPRLAVLAGSLVMLLVAWAASATWLYRLALANEREALANARTAARNAEQAERNAEQARRNADEARQSANRARDSEALARQREEAAGNVAQDALGQMVRLGEGVMRRLKATHDPDRIEAEWRRLRDDMLAMLEREMRPLAERVDRLQVTSFAVVALHQRLGDLLRRLGQVADARRQFQQGYDLVSTIAGAQPRNDVARANAGLMQVRLGELALDLDGDAARARDHFGRAWELQDEIARRPRSGQYKKVDNNRLLSGIAIKQGIAELRLGHPATARERFERALSERAAWVEAAPADLSALSYLSEAEVWLGVTLSHLGDWPDARPHLEAANEICRELADLRPRDLSFKADLAVVHGDHGDALARRGRYDDAGRAYERSMDFARQVLASNPDDAPQRLVLAAGYERLAALAVRRGNPADAPRHWRSALPIRTELAQVEPHDVPAQAALALALAHCGRCAEGTRKADELFRAAGDRPAVLLPLARCFAASASWATEGDRRRALDRALEILGAAARTGYRDRLELATDPDLALLRSDPRFKTLLAGISHDSDGIETRK